MTIRNISKDKNQATPVQRSTKSVQEAVIQGLTNDIYVLGSILEWRLVSEKDLAVSDSAEGIVVAEGVTEWTITRRSIPAGIHLVKFTASFTVGDPAFPNNLKAFDYGFIKVIPAAVRAIIDGGSSVRWGSNEIVTVDGSLSYDADIGPGVHTGLRFAWTCLDNASMISENCFGSFVGEANGSSPAVSIDPSKLETKKTYVLRLNVSKDVRNSFAEMSFEIAAGEVPQAALR